MHRTGSLFAGAPSAIGWLPEASANPCRTGFRRCRCSLLALFLILYSFLCLLLLRFQPAPQEFTEFPQLPRPQPLKAQNARPPLPLVPRRPQPPVARATLGQRELQQPQQAQSDHLRPRRPQHRFLRPRPALLPAQPLLEVPEPVLLTEAGAEQLYHLQPRQRRGAGDQGEALPVALHLGHDRLDRHLGTQHPPQAYDLLTPHPADTPVQEGLALLPLPGPTAPLTRRRQPRSPRGQWPSLTGTPLRTGQGVQPGILPQARDEVDALLVQGWLGQGPYHVGDREGAVEGGQVPAGVVLRLVPQHLDGQFILGAEYLDVGGEGQLTLAEVEATGQGQKPGGGALVGEQVSQDDPVVGADGGGTVGAAGGVLVKGTGAPDVLAGAVDLAVVEGVDAVAVPEAPAGVFEQVGEGPLDQFRVPVADLGKVLYLLPAVFEAQGDAGLADGVFLVVEGQSSDPDDEAAEAARGEGIGERGEQGLPQRPEQGSLHGTPPRDLSG